jgi:hypothetical protein
MSWDGDDLGVASELELVKEVFKKRYNFKVEIFTIPNTEDANRDVSGRIVEFQKTHDHPESLYIIYYGGHGSLTNNDCCSFHP